MDDECFDEEDICYDYDCPCDDCCRVENCGDWDFLECPDFLYYLGNDECFDPDDI